ncbi:MAG TPA: hypothetical protein VI999_00705 [Thermoplasmata archaeon]|nr:hypothetical protein [Thermoplasmata archaeon]
MAEEPVSEFDPRYNPGHDAIRVRAAREEHEVVLEPLFWGLFSLGGFLTAFLLPVTILALSFFVPLGLWPADRIGYAWLTASMNPTAANLQGLLVRLFFLVVIAGGLFHGAHRFKYMLIEAGAAKYETGLGVLLYGAAILGSLGALYYAVKGWIL